MGITGYVIGQFLKSTVLMETKFYGLYTDIKNCVENLKQTVSNNLFGLYLKPSAVLTPEKYNRLIIKYSGLIQFMII